MKGIRLKILILTALMLTISSGLMFYRSLFSLDVPKTVQKLDFEELRSLDLQINNSVFFLRKYIYTDSSELDAEIVRIKELMAIINEMKLTSPEMVTSVKKIREHFEDKQKKLSRFHAALKELKGHVNALVPSYNDLAKNNIRFTLDKNDKRDFYRECLLDVYMFLSFSHKENETRVLEDQKILGQVINFAETPNPLVLRYSDTIEGVYKNVKATDKLISEFREKSIQAEMNIIAKSYQEDSLTREKENETFLKLIFGAFFFYLIAMFIILKKN